MNLSVMNCIHFLIRLHILIKINIFVINLHAAVRQDYQDNHDQDWKLIYENKFKED